MNLDVDLGAIQWRKLVPSRRVLIWFCAVVVLGAIVGFTWQRITHPPRPWYVRWKLNRYLAKEAGSSNFKTDFAFPSKAEMEKGGARESAAPKGSRTGKDFEALREEYFALKAAAIKADVNARTNSAARTELEAKEQALAPVTADLWDIQRTWSEPNGNNPVGLARARRDLAERIEKELRGAPSYPVIYKLIGEQLWVAAKLLESKNVDHRREGILLALDASRDALNSAENVSVAAQIVNGYVWPHRDVVDTNANTRSPWSEENFMNQCTDVLRRANDTEGIAQIYTDYLKSHPERADWARQQIAGAYEQGGDYRKAIAYLKQVQNTNDTRLARRIGWLERRATQGAP
jgi:hypothetical protein